VLDTSEVDATERRLVEAPGSLPSIHRIAFWRLNAGNDSLELVWSTGFAGIVVHLPIGGDTLAGWAEEFSDQFMQDPPRTNAVAERVSCGAPLPDAIRERRPDLLVPVGGRADVLRIGAPLPASVGVQAEPGGEFLLATEPVGIYLGADSVRAILGPDRALNAVFLTYADTSAFNRVVAALRSQLGPPFGRLASLLDDLSWIDREMWIRAVPSRRTVTVASPKAMW
jgi:hypothetical protein